MCFQMGCLINGMCLESIKISIQFGVMYVVVISCCIYQVGYVWCLKVYNNPNWNLNKV